MTADPREEPGRPTRRRRRRRRPRGKASPNGATASDPGAGTGSSDVPASSEPSAEGTPEPPRKRRRRRRRRRPKPLAQGTPATADAPPASNGDGPAPPAGSRRRRRPHRPKRPKGTPKSSKASPAGPSRRIRTQREVSAGGVVYRRNGDGTIEILLASRRTRRGDLAWGLAKGGIEDGESNEDAAIREVREETGIVAEIEDALGETKYVYVWEDVRIRKTVHFFLMRATGGDPDDHDDEMEEVRWFPLDRAMKRAAYRGEREMLGRAADLLGS